MRKGLLTMIGVTMALAAATSYGVAKATTESPVVPDVYSAAKQDR